MKKIASLGRGFLAFLLLGKFFPVVAAWGGECVYQGEVATIKGLECLMGSLLVGVVPIAGLAVGIMVLAAGFKLLTVGSEKEGFQKAQATLTYAVFGLILVFLSWFILKFIEFFTGMSVTQFLIGQ